MTTINISLEDKVTIVTKPVTPITPAVPIHAPIPTIVTPGTPTIVTK